MAWAQVVSVRLMDPIVHPLCHLVQDYHHHKDEQKKIKSLQTQTTLLLNLEECLRNLRTILPPAAMWLTAEQLENVSKLIALPMKAILRSYQPFEDTNETKSPPPVSYTHLTLPTTLRV